MIAQFRIAPDAASSFAAPVDRLFVFMLLFSLLLTLGVCALIVYFSVRYRRRHPDETGAAVRTHMGVEITWMAIPLVIAMGMFGWGAHLYVGLSDPPKDAMEIHVLGKQWMWKVEHPGGRKEINELHVPLGRPVKLVMTSQDVIHSFFVPAFRIKQDVLPGRYSTQWFTPSKIGTYHLFCSQYCGTSHANMVGRVIVMPGDEYQAWLAGVPQAETPVAAGTQLFASYGCVSCHGQTAPSLAGVYGSPVLLTDGSTVTADETYLRESILNPRAKIVAGFGPIMPSFQGQLTEEQVFHLVAYIKSLKAVGGSTRPADSSDRPQSSPPNAPANNPIPEVTR
jgi:cytochrome c oxidase subunit 2